MKRHGKVLREPKSGPGLLMIDGQQFRFSVGGVWRSEVPPRPGMNVEVEIDGASQVTGITVIPGPRMGRGSAQQAFPDVKEEDRKVRARLVAKFVAMALIATALFLVGWLFLMCWLFLKN